MPISYDIIVIGSGGGLKIALPAARMGLRTALIEQDAVAGTCLNRGCIPSKMLIYPTELPQLLQDARRINVHNETTPRVDFSALVTRISRTVDSMSARQRKALLQTPNLDVISEHGEFIADKVLQAGPLQVTAPRVFIAAGAKPMIPPIPGLEETPFMTSTEALRRTDLPKRLIVIGAGYIAVELGTAYAGAGTQVDFIVRSRFLRQEDREIARAFSTEFGKHHVVHQGIPPSWVTYQDDLFTVTVGEQNLQADALLVVTGVAPCTEALGLEHTGIQTSDQGYIQVDDHLRTAVDGVYALGDCVGNFLFRHTVNYEGEYLVRTVLKNGPDVPIDYGPVPHAIFSRPEIAGVGLTEEQVQARGLDYVVGTANYANSNAGLARGYNHGFAKLLVETSSHRILGAHILGPEASNMIHLFIMAMKTQARLDDLLEMIFIHPALPEIARDAARNAAVKL